MRRHEDFGAECFDRIERLQPVKAVTVVKTGRRKRAPPCLAPRFAFASRTLSAAQKSGFSARGTALSFVT
jgi:hypothetical protein